MFSPLKGHEIAVLGRGVLILVVIVALGVAAAERQLNSLTHQYEFVRVFNVMRDGAGTCSAYLFGNSLTIDALYKVGRIQNIDRTIIIETPQFKFTLPTVLKFDVATAFGWLNVWRDQFVAEAYKTKQSLAGYAQDLHPVLTVVKLRLADAFHAVRELIAGGVKNW